MNRRRSGERNPALYMMLATIGVVLAFLGSTYYWYAIGVRISTDALNAQRMQLKVSSTSA
jgi:hypothetical protein